MHTSVRRCSVPFLRLAIEESVQHVGEALLDSRAHLATVHAKPLCYLNVVEVFDYCVERLRYHSVVANRRLQFSSRS